MRKEKIAIAAAALTLPAVAAISSGCGNKENNQPLPPAEQTTVAQFFQDKSKSVGHPIQEELKFLTDSGYKLFDSQRETVNLENLFNHNPGILIISGNTNLLKKVLEGQRLAGGKSIVVFFDKVDENNPDFANRNLEQDVKKSGPDNIVIYMAGRSHNQGVPAGSERPGVLLVNKAGVVENELSDDPQEENLTPNGWRVVIKRLQNLPDTKE